MDSGAFNPAMGYMTGEFVAVSVTATTCAILFASHLRRQTVRRRVRESVVSKSPAPSTLDVTLLSGLYRGRSMEMRQNADLLTVTVRVQNRGGLFAEFGNGDLPRAHWLPKQSQRRLMALSDRWMVAVRGRAVLLSCRVPQEPERLRFALDLACDLADGVDGMAR